MKKTLMIAMKLTARKCSEGWCMAAMTIRGAGS
jgi:hypothetical protein